MTVTEPTADAPVDTERPAPIDESVDEVVVEDVLVEEISIDGMCGVY